MHRAVLGRVIIATGVIAALLFATGANAGSSTTRIAFGVAHGAVTASNSQYVDTPPTGPSAGDLRAYYLPLTAQGSTKPIGYVTGTLTTVATGAPAVGNELRTANLVFVIGAAVNQIVVGGVAVYAESAPTIATKSVVTRPVVGGSGKYAGARGWCVSTHYANDTWTHVFHVTLER